MRISADGTIGTNGRTFYLLEKWSFHHHWFFFCSWICGYGHKNDVVRDTHYSFGKWRKTTSAEVNFYLKLHMKHLAFDGCSSFPSGCSSQLKIYDILFVKEHQVFLLVCSRVTYSEPLRAMSCSAARTRRILCDAIKRPRIQRSRQKLRPRSSACACERARRGPGFGVSARGNKQVFVFSALSILSHPCLMTPQRLKGDCNHCNHRDVLLFRSTWVNNQPSGQTRSSCLIANSRSVFLAALHSTRAGVSQEISQLPFLWIKMRRWAASAV